jgi:hypothetical protein
MDRLRIPALLFSPLFALSAAVSAWAAEAWPEIPSPPKAKVEWVGDNLRVNGVPTRVMQFQSQARRAEVVEYYRAYWSGGYPTRPSIKALGASTVISQKHGPYFMMVKVEDAARGASEGLIAVSRVAGSKVELNAGDLPLMPGARVVSVVESSDPGKNNREVVVINPQPLQSVLQFYQASYENGGWRQVQNNEASHAPKSPGGVFIVFARGNIEAQLGVTQAPNGRGCVLVANEVTKGTGPQRF